VLISRNKPNIWPLFQSTLYCFCYVDGIGLEQNLLSGDVPEELCDSVSGSTDIVDFWTDCGGINPNITCTCCTTCCSISDDGKCESFA
jgi:hypothetical protein